MNSHRYILRAAVATICLSAIAAQESDQKDAFGDTAAPHLAIMPTDTALQTPTLPNARRADSRIALVSSGKCEEVDKLMELATAELGRSHGLILVERTEIDRILSEQKLSLSAFANCAQTIVVGRLLRADICAVIAPSLQDKQPVGMTVFETETGRRLWDIPLPGNTEQAITGIIEGVHAAITKIQTSAQTLRTLCVLPVRNAGLPRELDVFCETVGMLLQRRLTRTVNLTVLERERLEHVTKESALPGAAHGQELLASVFTLEVEMTRHSDGKGLRAVTALRDGTGTEIRRTAADQPGTVSMDIVDRLLDDLLKALESQPAGAPYDRAVEARRFACEAVTLRNQANPAAALRAIHAAFALDSNQEYFKELALCQMAEALTFLEAKDTDKANLNYALSLVREAVTARHEALRNFTCEKALELRDNLIFGWNDFQKLFRKICFALENAAQRQADNKSEIDATETVCRTYLTYVIDRSLAMARHDPEALGHFSSHTLAFDTFVESYGQMLDVLMPNEKVFPRERVEFGLQWLDLFAKHKTEQSAWRGLSEPGAVASAVLHGLTDLRRSGGRGPERPPVLDTDKQLRQRQIEKMQSHPLQIVRIYGDIAELRDAMVAGAVAGGARREKYNDVKKTIRRLITESSDVSDEINEAMGHTVALHAIELLCADGQWQFRELIDIWEFMLARKRLQSDVILRIIMDIERKYESETDRIKALIDLTRRTIQLCDSPDLQTAGNVSDTRSILKRRLSEMTKDYPELVAQADSVPWRSAVSLIEISPEVEGGGRFLSPPVLAAECAFAVRSLEMRSLKIADEKYQAVKVPLSGAPVDVIGEVPATQAIEIATICLGEENFYMSTYSRGVFVFPLKGGEVWRLNADNGLPSNRALGLTEMSGTLYIGLGAPHYAKDTTSHIVAYDLKSKSFQVLASNSRREKISPFDDQGTFDVDYMFADSPRHRIILNIRVTKPHAFRNVSELTGLWEFDARNSKFQKLVDIQHTVACQNAYMAREAVVGDYKWVCKPFCRISRDGKTQLLPTQKFGEILSIQPLGNGRVFLASDRGMWLLDLE